MDDVLKRVTYGWGIGKDGADGVKAVVSCCKYRECRGNGGGSCIHEIDACGGCLMDGKMELVGR